MTNQNTGRSEIGRTCYPRRNKHGHTLRATATFFDDDTYRFEQTDGWELNAWNYEPSNAEVQFARFLLSRDTTNSSNGHLADFEQEFDDQMAYDILTIPDCFEDAFRRLADLAKVVANDSTPRHAFFLLDALQELNSNGCAILDDLIKMKTRFRSWVLGIDNFALSLRTFDENLQGCATIAGVGCQGRGLNPAQCPLV